MWGPSKKLTVQLASSQLLQRRCIAIEKVRISTIRVRVRILPNGLIRPASRNGTWSASIPRKDQGRFRIERCTVTRASRPPVVRAVNQRIPPGAAVIGRHETLDPGDHGGLAEAVARGSRRVVLDVEHAGQRDAVVRPASAVSEEVASLRRTGAFVWVCKVIAAADQACTGRAAVVGREGGILVGCAFCRLFG